MQNVDWLLNVSTDFSCFLVAERHEICSGSKSNMSLQATQPSGCSSCSELQIDIDVMYLLGNIPCFLGLPKPCSECTWQHWKKRLSRKPPEVHGPGWWHPESPGTPLVGDWDNLSWKHGCVALHSRVQATADPFKGIQFLLYLLLAPNIFLWVGSILVVFANLPVWHLIGSSLYSQCGAIWKLHFTWKWTLLPWTQPKWFFNPIFSPFWVPRL